MEEIIFKCETITPMFLSGADGETPEIRPASIKGALRFWWRALHGDLSIKELLEKETEIFGGSGEDGNATRSKVVIRVKSDTILNNISKSKFPYEKTTSIHKGKSININILEYLSFGISVYEKGKGNVFVRDYIKTGYKFEIRLKFNKKNEEEIIGAFKLLLRFGGLGAKSRNGFGSIICYNLEYYNIKHIKILDSTPNYLAFNKNMKIFKTTKTYDCWNKALGEIGIAYKVSREKLDIKHNYANRQFIAAPIQVGKVQHSLLNRRSKPYFLSVKKDNQGGYYGEILFLNSKYAEGLTDKEVKFQNKIVLDRKYAEVCSKMNKNLSERMELI